MAASAADIGIHNKILGSRSYDPRDFGSGVTLFILNEEVNIMKIVRSLENSGLLINDVSEKWNIKQNNRKMGFLVCYR